MNHFYFRYLLSNDPRRTVSPWGIRLRKLVHPLLIRVAPLFSRRRLVVVRRAAVPSGRPIIFAATHGFKDDALFTLLTVQRHAYLLFGSLPQFFGSSDGLSAWLNGAILVDRRDKASRHASKEKMVRALALGADLIYYPEGTWNKSENQLVLQLFPGIYEVAARSGALVVPVATHQEGNLCYAILGEAFDLCGYDREQGLRELRDRMGALKYELIAGHSRTDRRTLLAGASPQGYWQRFVQGLLDEVDCYDPEVEANSAYIDPAITTPRQAFGHLQAIEYTPQNAFLLRRAAGFYQEREAIP